MLILGIEGVLRCLEYKSDACLLYNQLAVPLDMQDKLLRFPVSSDSIGCYQWPVSEVSKGR